MRSRAGHLLVGVGTACLLCVFCAFAASHAAGRFAALLQLRGRLHLGTRVAERIRGGGWLTGGANTRAGGRRGWKWDERGHGDDRWGFAQRQQLGGLFGWEWGGEQSRAETLLRVDLDMARYPKAVCNDGSPGAYYVKRNPSSRTWLVFLEGAGWCWDLASCQKRAAESPPHYTSSRPMPATYDKAGIFSPDAAISPFASANKVFLPSCSSDAFVGDVGAEDNELGWHFRGQELVRASLHDLQVSTDAGPALAEGDTVYWSGCSSGARGALFTYEYMPALLPAGASVFGLFDSPLWVDVAPLNPRQTPLKDQVRAVLALTRAEGRLGAECVEMYAEADEHWRCLLPEFRAAAYLYIYMLYTDVIYVHVHMYI